ncbi:MAG: hypothetical protein JWP01_2103 [Myxococcales bacterium]|nr:hypothetical protein [Myxococcales bacterium]
MTDPTEQDAPPRWIERPLEQLVQALVGDLGQMAVVLHRLLEQASTIERTLGDPRRSRRIDGFDLGLVPVADTEPVTDVIGCQGRCVAGHAQQQLTQLEAPVTLGLAVALWPRVDDRVRVVERARMLRTQTAKVIVVLATG